MDKINYKLFLHAVDEADYARALNHFKLIYDPETFENERISPEMAFRVIPFIWYSIDGIKAVFDYQMKGEDEKKDVNLRQYRIDLSIKLFNYFYNQIIMYISTNQEKEIISTLKILSIFPLIKINQHDYYKTIIDYLIEASEPEQFVKYLNAVRYLSPEAYEIMLVSTYQTGGSKLWKFVEVKSDHSHEITKKFYLSASSLNFSRKTRKYLRHKLERQQYALNKKIPA